MKNLKTTTVFVFFMVSLVYSNHSSINSNSLINSFCEKCLQGAVEDCNRGHNTKLKNLEFPSLYKYNNNEFSTCDFNASNSISNIETKIVSKINELRSHENHLHRITWEIKTHHKSMINNNTKASFNYVVLLDSNKNLHQEMVDYGIKLKLK